jgi:hypothetical protein
MKWSIEVVGIPNPMQLFTGIGRIKAWTIKA